MILENLMSHNAEVVKRLAIATAELMQEALAPEFASDTESLVFVAGPPLTADAAAKWAVVTANSRMDMIYLAFEAGKERNGPVGASVFGERSGVVYRWIECSIWSPEGSGPFLVMPKALQVCFSHDGKALISHTTRPTRSLSGGVLRARKRIAKAARSVTEEQLTMAGDLWKAAA